MNSKNFKKAIKKIVDQHNKNSEQVQNTVHKNKFKNATRNNKNATNIQQKIMKILFTYAFMVP